MMRKALLRVEAGLRHTEVVCDHFEALDHSLILSWFIFT